MSDGAALQFGRREEGLEYRDRPCAFGVAERDGRLALVRVTRGSEAAFFDLPGGALDEGEAEAQALEREFGEETGLKVRAEVLLSRADEYLLKFDGEPINNRCGLWRCAVQGEAPELKTEPEHELVWMPPEEALRVLRHDSHAWAVACWLRSS
ncbi:MAG TPA: NUDIX domain-containing protein [Caulobacteraceae bacterium]